MHFNRNAFVMLNYNRASIRQTRQDFLCIKRKPSQDWLLEIGRNTNDFLSELITNWR